MGAQVVQGDVGWRRCKKCQAAFFTGNSNGKCPAAGAHDPAFTMGFFISHSGGSFPAQDNWRKCRKCDAMFFAGNSTRGVCLAGGAHDALGSANYALMHNLSVPPDFLPELAPQVRGPVPQPVAGTLPQRRKSRLLAQRRLFPDALVRLGSARG